jgi:hypothetical protein
MKRLLKVTREDISKANSDLRNPANLRSRYCPVAQCLTRENFNFKGVTSLSIFFGYEWRLPLPDHVQNFIHEYDNNQIPEPIEFEMEFP